MPTLKKPSKITKPTNIKSKWAEGDRVSFEAEDGIENGEITDINGKIATVKTDADEEYNVEIADLKPAEVEEEAEEAEEEEEKPAKKKVAGKKGKGTSLGRLFDETDAAPEMGGGFPEGNWEALITGGAIEETDKGTSAYFELVGVNDEDVEGKTQRLYYQLVTPDDEAGAGLPFFKRDLAKLGYEDVASDDVEATFEEIIEEEPWVSVNVRPRKDGSGYNNIYLDGLMDDQDDKPSNPA